jgi:aspartate/methionine/tyrosine aminotransferase
VTHPFVIKKLLFRSGVARYIPSLRKLAGGSGIFGHHYSDRLLAGPSYKEIHTSSEARELQGPDVISLALDAPRVVDAISSGSTRLALDKGGTPPAQGLVELRKAIARLPQIGPTIGPDNILVTQGASGAFATVLDTFINPRDQVLLFDPGSPLYPIMLRQRRARIQWLSTWIEKGMIRFRFDRLAKRLRGAKFLVVNSPGNPTGGSFAAEDLEQIAWWARRRDVLIINDRVFEHYDYDGPSANIASIAKAAPRTLTIGSLSKSHGLASLRVGWLAGSEELVRPCTLTAAAQRALVPTVCQQIAAGALCDAGATLKRTRADLDSRRRYTFERLQAMGLKAPWPSGAFFFWVPVGQLGFGGRTFARELFASKKVLVTSGECYGPSGLDCIRLSYATESGRLREGLNRISDFLREPTGHIQTGLKAA